MSRPRVNPEEAARANFQREVKVCRIYLDMTKSELADAVGVVPSVMSVLLNKPGQNQRWAAPHDHKNSWD